MKLLALFSIIFIASIPAKAQIELIGDNYFPADLEFEEIQRISRESRIIDPGGLKGVESGKLIGAVGFDSYAQRSYDVENSGILSVEVVSLLDSRAAYSLLTLLRTSEIREGPPGDAFASGPDSILFCHGRRWIRILGQGVSNELMLRVAGSVSNRIGTPVWKKPALISLFPAVGLDISTLRYFPGTESFLSFHEKNAVRGIHVISDMEIAQAGFAVGNQSGILSLLKFPTHEIAEDYFAELSSIGSSREEASYRTYFRRIGPLLALLEGSFNAETADDILSPIQYTYTVQWIYDKNSRPTSIWGIPASILSSTVLAFFIVVLACSLSILAGIGLAACRLSLRRLFPKNPLDNPKRTEITRLKLK